MDDSALNGTQIDALLAQAALRGSDDDSGFGSRRRSVRGPKHVKGYDFRRPEKFSRDHLHAFRGVHEQFVRLLNPALAGYLRTNVQFALEGVMQLTYQEFAADSKANNLVFVVSLEPLPAPILLEVSAELVFASLDRLLGGVGKRFRLDRDATELERSLFQEQWLTPVLDNLCDAWASIIAVTPTVQTVESGSNPVSNLVQIALPTDVVVVTEASAAVGDARGLLRLCYPYAAVEPIVPRLGIQRLISPGVSRRRADDSEHVRRGLSAISVPVVVRLGTADVTVAELLDLQVGDVVRLNTLVDQELDVLIDQEPKYRGRPGLKRQRVAVRVSTVLDDRTNEEETDASADEA
jgi:flagellar motor switch protein FliM